MFNFRFRINWKKFQTIFNDGEKEAEPKWKSYKVFSLMMAHYQMWTRFSCSHTGRIYTYSRKAYGLRPIKYVNVKWKMFWIHGMCEFGSNFLFHLRHRSGFRQEFYWRWATLRNGPKMVKTKSHSLFASHILNCLPTVGRKIRGNFVEFSSFHGYTIHSVENT